MNPNLKKSWFIKNLSPEFASSNSECHESEQLKKGEWPDGYEAIFQVSLDTLLNLCFVCRLILLRLIGFLRKWRRVAMKKWMHRLWEMSDELHTRYQILTVYQNSEHRWVFNSIQFRYLHAPTYKLSRWRVRRTQKTWSPGWGLQEKKWVFNLILKLFSESPGSRRCTGSAFQAADDAK